TAWCLVQGALSASQVAPWLETRVAREIFRAPGAILANGTGPAGRAIVVDGGYRLTGVWRFASGCTHATRFKAASLAFTPGGAGVGARRARRAGGAGAGEDSARYVAANARECGGADGRGAGRGALAGRAGVSVRDGGDGLDVCIARRAARWGGTSAAAAGGDE